VREETVNGQHHLPRRPSGRRHVHPQPARAAL